MSRPCPSSISTAALYECRPDDTKKLAAFAGSGCAGRGLSRPTVRTRNLSHDQVIPFVPSGPPLITDCRMRGIVLPRPGSGVALPKADRDTHAIVAADAVDTNVAWKSLSGSAHFRSSRCVTLGIVFRALRNENHRDHAFVHDCTPLMCSADILDQLNNPDDAFMGLRLDRRRQARRMWHSAASSAEQCVTATHQTVGSEAPDREDRGADPGADSSGQSGCHGGQRRHHLEREAEHDKGAPQEIESVARTTGNAVLDHVRQDAERPAREQPRP